MMTYDMEFDFYSDEPPKYFSRPANEFDGYDPKESGEENRQAHTKPNRRERICIQHMLTH